KNFRYNLAREQLVGKGIFEAFPTNTFDPTDTGAVDLSASLEEVMLNKAPHQLPIQRYDLKGADDSFTKRYWKVENVPILDSDGHVSYIIHTTEDITEEVKAHELKQRMEGLEEVHNVFLQGPVAISIVRGQDHILELANEAALRLWAKTEAIIGRPLLDAIPELKEQLAYDKIDQVYKTGELFHAKEVVVTTIREGKEGEHYYDVYFKVFYDLGSEKVSGVFTELNDATDKVEARKQLEEAEQNLRNTILQAPVAMAILRGPLFVVEIANATMYELWGKEEREMHGKSVFVALPEARDQGYEELLSGVYTTGERFTALGIPVTLPRNDTIETVYINLLYEAFKEGDGSISGIIVVATDVTAQVTARMKIEESHKEFQFVTDFMPQLIWVTRADGYPYYYNKQWYDYTGLTYGETEGEGWNHVFHPDDQQKAWKAWRNSLETGESYEIEYRCRRWDGQYRWFLGRALPLKDDSGTILKWFGTRTDIDDQKKASEIMEIRIKERTEELHIANKELFRSNQNLEEFAHAASHDMKEPIRKVLTFSERLKESLADRLNQTELDLFGRMDHASYRMRHLVEDLLNFSFVSQSSQQTEEVDLNKTLAEVLTDLELLIEQKQPGI
ncbi:MAG: PAS domain-containing protein, partial [Chitinophagaceae bacterium]